MIFLVVFSSVLLAVHLYIARRAITDTHLPQPWRAAAWSCILVLWASLPLSLLLRSNIPHDIAFVPYVWLGALFYLFFFLLVRDVVRFVAALAQRAVRKQQDAPEDPERRVFVARAMVGGVALATVGIGAVGVRSAVGEISLPEVSVRLARLPKALDGFKIVQLSDVHIGPMLGQRFLKSVVEQTNRLRPDLIVITGDLVDGRVAEIGATVGLLQNLNARHGTFFVTGNHEYYSGCEEWTAFLRSLDIGVLMNERRRIEDGGVGFDVLGIPDHHAYPVLPDIQRAALGRDPESELIVLAHQPIQIVDSLSVNAGLQLSGHTHGGQIQPFGQIVSLVQPYVAGLHRERDTQIYVSRGTGFWGPPMRVLAPAEITSIHLISG